MIDEELQKQLRDRLSRIQGQIGGVARMIEEQRYCVDVLTQTRAISAALRNVENMVLENHLNTCVADAMRVGSDDESQAKTSEIMDIISKFRR